MRDVITVLVLWLGGWAIVTAFVIGLEDWLGFGGMVWVLGVWLLANLGGAALLLWTANRQASRAKGQLSSPR